MLSQHAMETNHRSGIQTHCPSIHSADKLSQHTLQNLHCTKEAAKAQNGGQADTAKIAVEPEETHTGRASSYNTSGG